MPTIDLTVTITTVLALVAIISPVLTAIIDNIFRLILKHSENKQNGMNRTLFIKGKSSRTFSLLLMKSVISEMKKQFVAMLPATLWFIFTCPNMFAMILVV